MVIIDGKNSFSIRNCKLKNTDGGLVFTPNKDFWESELFFQKDEHNTIKKIIQRLPKGGDTIVEYKNLNSDSQLYILLSKVDYKKVFAFYNNLKTNKNFKKKAIIKAGATIISYYCHQYFCLEKQSITEYDLNDLLRDTEIDSISCKKYKKEIISMTKKILKNEYKVSNKDLNYIFQYENVEDKRCSKYI